MNMTVLPLFSSSVVEIPTETLKMNVWSAKTAVN